jgi:hypothetical protein
MLKAHRSREEVRKGMEERIARAPLLDFDSAEGHLSEAFGDGAK